VIGDVTDPRISVLHPRAVDDPAEHSDGLHTGGSALGYGHDDKRRVLRGKPMTDGYADGPLRWQVR
jgi:hypothetical protein